jgi:hypothetical protein
MAGFCGPPLIHTYIHTKRLPARTHTHTHTRAIMQSSVILSPASHAVVKEGEE